MINETIPTHGTVVQLNKGLCLLDKPALVQLDITWATSQNALPVSH